MRPVYFAYILKSLKTDNYYYGSTSDLEKRLQQHNAGKTKYTKSRRPWIVHYFEEFPDRSSAMQREFFFKSPDGYAWLKSKGIT